MPCALKGVAERLTQGYLPLSARAIQHAAGDEQRQGHEPDPLTAAPLSPVIGGHSLSRGPLAHKHDALWGYPRFRVPSRTRNGGGGVDLVLVIVGIFVAVGTPLGTYIAARKGHEVTERTAELAAETARDVAVAAAKTATAANRTNREEHDRSHIRWACDKLSSTDPTARDVGISVLKSMLLDDELDHHDLVTVAGVLEVVTSDAVSRIGDLTRSTVAERHPEGDADERLGWSSGEGG